MTRRLLALMFLCLASCALYLGVSVARVGALTFPLDDAWIHWTFARNLALHHEVAFIHGQPSAGSTAPFWTIALTPAFLLPLAPDWWTCLLGRFLRLGGGGLVYCFGVL